jgi:hypothetical protein
MNIPRPSHLLIVAGLLALPATLPAALLSYEGFDYTAGFYDNDGPSTPLPLASAESPAYYGDYTALGNDIQIVGTSLAQGASPFATTGGAFTKGEAGQFDNFRMSLGTNSVGATDVTTIYMSYLVQMDDNVDNAFRLSFGDNQRLGAGIFNDGGTRRFMAEANSARDFGGTVSLATSYFVVAKMEFGNGTDTVSMSAYAPGDTVPGTEPVTWDATVTANVTAEASLIRLDIYDTAAGAVVLDELRLGTTFDAVAIPEPSTLMLVGVALAGVGLLHHRKRF